MSDDKQKAALDLLTEKVARECASQGNEMTVLHIQKAQAILNQAPEAGERTNRAKSEVEDSVRIVSRIGIESAHADVFDSGRGTN